MPMYDKVCTTCGCLFSDIYEGVAAPPAYHETCGGLLQRAWTSKAASVIGDEIDETHHDLDPHGGTIRFRSRQEKQRYLDAHQLEPFVRHTTGDRHVPRWASMDRYTLEAATALVARAGSRAADTTVRCETLQLTVRTLTEAPPA